MARTRQIKPNYPFEKEIRALSIPARYFYELSWCHMSDPNPKEKIVGGVLPYDLFYLQTNIFPGENVDVAPLVDEIIAQKRYFLFKSQGKQWFWCPTMAKHQNIQHPAKEFKYPDPPKELVEQYNNHTLLNEPSMSPHIPLTKSRVELSRVEKKNQPYWAAFSKETQELLKTISKEFNIYQLINKLKKDNKIIEIPEEVLVKICNCYLKNKGKIKADWPWFVVSVEKAWQEWNAEQQIKQGQEWKKAPVAPAIVQILAEMAHKVQKKE